MGPVSFTHRGSRVVNPACLIEEAKSQFRQLIAELCREAGLRDPELLADELFLLGEGARVASQAVGPRSPVQRLFEIFRSLVGAHTRQEN